MISKKAYKRNKKGINILKQMRIQSILDNNKKGR